MALRVFSPEELEQIRREQMESGLYDRLLSDYEPAEEEAPQQQKPVERGAWDTVTSSVARSVDQSQALGWGVLAAGADLVGADGVRDRALEGYNEQMRQAAENPAEIGTYKNIDSISDAGTYALESLGELVPTLATILVSGGIGGGIARAAAPKVLGQMLEKQIAANIAKGATREAAEAAAKKYVQSTLGGIGEKVGGWAASSALEAGSMYGDDVKEHGVEGVSAGRALGLGALSGATDVMLGGESLMLGKILGGMGKDAAEKGSKYIGREMLKGFAREGGQEVLQEIIQMGNSVVSSMQNTGTTTGEVLSEKGGEFLDRGIDSFLKGGIAGVPMAAGGHMLDKRIAMLDAERKKAAAEGDVNKLTQIDKQIAEQAKAREEDALLAQWQREYDEKDAADNAELRRMSGEDIVSILNQRKLQQEASESVDQFQREFMSQPITDKLRKEIIDTLNHTTKERDTLYAAVRSGQMNMEDVEEQLQGLDKTVREYEAYADGLRRVPNGEPLHRAAQVGQRGEVNPQQAAMQDQAKQEPSSYVPGGMRDTRVLNDYVKGTTPMNPTMGLGLLPLLGRRQSHPMPSDGALEAEWQRAESDRDWNARQQQRSGNIDQARVNMQETSLDNEWNARQAELRQRNDQARVNQMDTDLDKTEAKIRAEHEAKRDQMRANAMGQELDADWQARQDEVAVRNQEADLNNTEHKIRQQLAERQAKNAKFAPVYERLNKKANKGNDVSQDEASDRLEAAAAEAPRKVTIGEAVRRIEEAKAEGDNADMAHLNEWIKTLKDAEAEADADTTSLRSMSEWVSFIRNYQDQYGTSVGSQKELAKVMGDAAYERDNERMEADWARRADEHKVKADNATLDAEWVTRLEERDRANAQRQTAAVSKQTEQTADAPKVELATIKNKKTKAKRTKAEILEAARGSKKESKADMTKRLADEAFESGYQNFLDTADAEQTAAELLRHADGALADMSRELDANGIQWEDAMALIEKKVEGVMGPIIRESAPKKTHGKKIKVVSDAPTVQSGNTITRKAKQNDAKAETKKEATTDPIAALREAVMAESASAKKTYTDEQKADRAGVIEDLAEIRGNKNHYLQTVASKYFSKPELRRLFDFLAKQGDDADLTVEDIVKGAKIAPHSLDINVDDLGRMFKKKGRKGKAKAKAAAETKTQEKTEPKAEPKAEPRKEDPVEPKTKPLIDRVKAVFPGMDYRELKDTGSVIVVTPNGSAILIREEDVLINDNVEGHWSNSAIVEKDFGVRLDRGGIIALSKLNQADTTLDHEMVHAAMSLALTETERKILYKQYGGDTKNRRAAEEKIAEAYEKWKPAPTKAEEKKGLFRKMWDASKKLHRVLFGGKETADTADQVMARLRSGEAWKKDGGREVGLTLDEVLKNGITDKAFESEDVVNGLLHPMYSLSDPVRKYAMENTEWSDDSDAIWVMLDTLTEFDKKLAKVVGNQRASREEMVNLFGKKKGAEDDWVDGIDLANEELGTSLVALDRAGIPPQETIDTVFMRKGDLSDKAKNKLGPLVAGHGRYNAFEINGALSDNPSLAAELAEYQDQVNKRFGVTPFFVNGKITMTGIEQREATYEDGTANRFKPKFGGFARSFAQTFLEALPKKTFEKFRREVTASVEHAYKNGGKETTKKGLVGLKFMDKSIDNVSKSEFSVAGPVKKAEKTVGALNLNSACPMFMIGSHGCYFDGCYVTGMGMGGNTITFYQKAAYTGEILQLSNEDIKLLNSVGGLRLNGQGDLSHDMREQLEDIVKHAKMRDLKLKVITKQDATLEMLQDMHDKGIDISGVQVQTSVDPYWIPITEDDVKGSLGEEWGVGKVKDITPDLAEKIIEAYASSGREAKVIDGKLYRKYGYSMEKATEAKSKYKDVNFLTRAVVGTPEEIVYYARNYPHVLQTWMHAAIRPGMYSDVTGSVLKQGEIGNFTARIAIIKDAKGEWRVLAQANATNATVGNKGDVTYQLTKQIKDAERKGDTELAEKLRKQRDTVVQTRAAKIPTKERKTYTAVEKFIKEQPDAERIFQTLAGSLDGDPSALCCAAGADKDACNNCVSGCHRGSKGWNGLELSPISGKVDGDGTKKGKPATDKSDSKAKDEEPVNDDLTPMYSMASKLMDQYPQYKDNLLKAAGPKQQSATRKFLKMMQSAKDGDALTYNTIKDELFAWMRRSLFDTYDQIKVVGKKVDELTGGRLGDLAYKTMRLSTSIDSIMGALLQHGALTWDGGVSKVTTKDEGLLPLIEELGDDALPWLLSRVARRAQKFINETYTDEDGNVVTKEKWLTQEDVDAYNAIAKPLREARPDLWAKADKQYEALQQSVLDFAVEAGTINKDDMEVWKHAEYIPFYRIITDAFGEESPVVGLPGGKKIISGIHKLEGGKTALDNPLVNITKNWSILVTQAVKNNARTKAIDMALELGDAVVTKVSDKMKGRDNVLNIMRNGRDEYYMIHDREFFRALHTAPSILTNNAIMKVAQKAKRLVTYGATFTLDFRLANMIRDTIQTMALNKDYTFSDAINGFKKAWNEDMDFIELKAAGGAFSSGYLHGTNPDSIVNYVEKVVKKDGKTKVEKLSPMRLLEWWNKVGDAAENANRVALYAKKKNAGALDAAYDAKDLLDFSMRGGNEAMRMMTILVPFLNARIAGLYKMRRAMFKDRMMDGWKPNVTDEFWRTAKMLTLTSGALMAYTMAFHKDEWDKLQPYEKRGYYHLWIGDEHFRIPKPFEMGAIFSSIPEAIFDSMREKDAKILGEAVWSTMLDTFALNPMPQLVKPMTEVWANKNSYTGNDIVPQGMENLEPGLQAKEDTKDILKLLGEKFNVSPAKMQHLIQGYTGGMGIMALTAADVIIEASDLKLDNPVNRNNVWGIGKFWRDDEMVSSKQVSEFYEFAREVDKAVYTISALKAQGDVSKLRDYIEDNADLLANKQVVSKMKSAFRNIRTQMKLVKASKTMSADQKDEAIRKLIAVRNGYAEQFVNGIVKRRD